MITKVCTRGLPAFSATLGDRAFNHIQSPTRPNILACTSDMGSSARSHAFSSKNNTSIINCHERPLNGLERFFYEVAKNQDNDTISGYRIQLKNALPSTEIMRKALTILQEKMPALKTNIINSNSNINRVVFEEINQFLPVSYKEIEVKAAGAWKEILSFDLQKPFDAAQDPLVQFIGVKNASGEPDQLLTIAHHSLMDGEGMLHVYQVLLDIIDTVTKPASDLTAFERLDIMLGAAESASLSDPVCELHIENYEFQKPKLSFLIMSIMVDFIAKKIMPLFDSQELKPATAIHDLTFTQADTAQLLLAAKKNGVSIYGAMAAAGIRTVGEFFPHHPAGQLVTTFSPVSLRNRLAANVNPDELGCYTSLVRDIVHVSPQALSQAREPVKSKKDQQAFWDLAKKTHGQIRESLDAGEHEAIPYIFEAFFKTESDPAWLAKAVVPDTLILNNLGRQELHSKQQGVEAFSWVTSFGTLAPGVSINFLTLNNELHVALFSRRLDTPTLQKFAARFEAELRACSHLL